jgi:hypothetical protein
MSSHIPAISEQPTSKVAWATSAEEWERNRFTITNLYRDKNLTLAKVAEVMAESFGFYAK